ncbi:hypothetical protein PVAG01_02661 [Phlyctema vagabunda]|uniref:Uncharacterized protein n=1 Tax=Phlyctema vagabunda TaxID=108571 RepID=A0ABR4PRH3_9HELO
MWSAPASPARVLCLTIPLISPVAAIYGLAGSPCAAKCGNVLSTTTGEDIVCPDASYPSSGNPGSVAGVVFESCVSCQVQSNYTDLETGDTDLQRGLYNMRYAISWCLFGFPNNTEVADTPCITSRSCGPLEAAFEFDNLSTPTAAFGYCPDLFMNEVDSCSNCLRQLSNEFYLSNFLTALNVGCIQKPPSGSTIALDGSLFSSISVNMSNPEASSSSSFSAGGDGLTLSERVGIAVGAIVGVLIIAGICTICIGKKRRRRALAARQRQSGYLEWQRSNQAMTSHGRYDSSPIAGTSGTTNASGNFFDSPQSQRPLNSQNWGASSSSRYQEESPIEKTYFSPYSSQYNSPVSGSDARPIAAHEWPYPLDSKPVFDKSAEKSFPVDRKGSSSSAGGLRQRSREREVEGERIEMQNVPPVLMHPGHGRGKSASLTEDDYRSGRAV